MDIAKRALTSYERTCLETLLQKVSCIHTVISEIARNGGECFLVGGVVRDLLLQRSLEDIDIEVHGLSSDAIYAVLERYGHVQSVGKAYGVLKFTDDSGASVDWSLPRTDGRGRKPDVALDPDMDIVHALRRRDLTMNALAVNLMTYELIDPFGGEKDLEQSVLRCPDTELFAEDPLRFYRVMQFVARFDMYPDEQLHELCRTMNVQGVSRERICQEFRKMLLLSTYPSRGLRWLHALGRLSELYPELGALEGVEQPPQYHPEGDVLEHTFQVLDASVRFTILDTETHLALMYGALCHDIGKPEATRREDGRVRSTGHDVAGVPIARALLKRITPHKKFLRIVGKYVRHHMAPLGYIKTGAKAGAYKRLAKKLEPELNLYLLSCLAEADHCGRNGDGHTPLQNVGHEVKAFRDAARDAGVFYQSEPPVVTGEDLRPYVEPGPDMGVWLSRAYDIQISQGLAEKEAILRQLSCVSGA